MTDPGFLSRLTARFISPLIWGGLELWSASWKKDRTEISTLLGLLGKGERAIVVAWHGKYLPLFALARELDAMVVVGKGFRGEILKRICRRFGYGAAMIELDGRAGVYDQVRDAFGKARLGAIIVDGPLGPYHVVKPGAVRLASELGYFIVPLSVTSRPVRVMQERWDKRELPAWRARVTLAVGEPLAIPPGLDSAGVALWCSKLRDELEALDERAEAAIDTGTRA